MRRTNTRSNLGGRLPRSASSRAINKTRSAAADQARLNAEPEKGFSAGQVDGLVVDLPTAFYLTAAEIPDASIVGILPTVGDEEELGMLFETDSPLIPCVNQALAAVEESGDLAALQEEWLADGGDIPTLTQ